MKTIRELTSNEAGETFLEHDLSSLDFPNSNRPV